MDIWTWHRNLDIYQGRGYPFTKTVCDWQGMLLLDLGALSLGVCNKTDSAHPSSDQLNIWADLPTDQLSCDSSHNGDPFNVCY